MCVSVHPHTGSVPWPGTFSLLAEALLEQAMIGPSPNPLILSYLKYAISSQVMTFPMHCMGHLTAHISRGEQRTCGVELVIGRYPPKSPIFGLGRQLSAQHVPKAGLFLSIASAHGLAAGGMGIVPL